MEDYSVTVELIQDTPAEVYSIKPKKNNIEVKDCKIEITFKNQYGNILVSMFIDIENLIPEHKQNKNQVLQPNWFNIKDEKYVISIISQDDRITYLSSYKQNNVKILEIFIRLDNNCTSSINMHYYFKYDERIDEMMNKMIEIYKNNVYEKK